MNVALVGNSRVNAQLKRILEKEGFTVNLLEGFSGGTDEGCVIITRESALTEKGMDSSLPVVILLDDGADSPSIITRLALEKATVLARSKRKVIFLSKYMRTSGEGMEAFYSDARDRGVMFIKYRKVDIKHKDGIYNIGVSDEYGGMEIEASRLFTPAIESLETINKLMRLRDDGEYFMYAHLTSRNGVYRLDAEDAQMNIRHIIADMRKKAVEKPKFEVDAAKCAFCYTCYRACPHAAMAPDNQNAIMKNLSEACSRCGICSAICPAEAIAIEGEAVCESERKKLIIFCCENSGELAIKGLEGDFEAVPLNCGGGIDAKTILAALKTRERVLVAVCPEKACRHFDGSKRVKGEVLRAKEMLKKAGLDETKVELINASHVMDKIVSQKVSEMINKGVSV